MIRVSAAALRRSGALVLALALAAGAGPRLALAQSGFPTIRGWLLAGAFQDSSNVSIQTIRRCPGSLGPRPDSLRRQAVTLSLRFLRDRVAEKRPDFGGYRIYRMINLPDTTKAELVRRFSINAGSELTWHFSTVDTAANSYDFLCQGAVVHDSIVTFVDPDSNGQFQKVCRKPGTLTGRCLSPGDSVEILVAPPGPHDGFLTWYSITYEKKNTTDTDYEDLFVPDTLDAYARCRVPGDPNTCPNLNNKLRSLIGPAEPTGGPTANLEQVRVVPNPYRGGEVWDPPGSNEIHFINLPQHATIRIYTVAGDLVRTLRHDDPVRDFERWDLTSGAGREIASGIYMYRVEAGSFSFQSRFIVIR